MGLFETAILGLSLTVLMIIMGFVLGMKSLPDYADDQQCLTRAEARTLNCGNQKDVLLDFLQAEIGESFMRIDKDVQERADSQGTTWKYYLKNRYWQMKPAAKITRISEDSDTISDTKVDMTPIVNWDTENNMFEWGGFKRYGIFFKHDRIVVPVSGVYFLYSYIDLTDEEVAVPKNETFKHSMYKYNYYTNQETEVLTAFMPLKAKEEGHFNRYSSFVSGLVNLTAGEEISLKVSDIKLLKYSVNNCMGINLL